MDRRLVAPAAVLAALTLVAAATLAMLTTGAAAYAAGKITGHQIKDGTVTGKDVRDRSLTSADFAAGQLPAGPKGDRGEKGDPGVQGPPGFDTTQLVVEPVSVPAGQAGTRSATCPTGTTVVGGGYEVPDAYANVAQVLQDRPLLDGSGWAVRVANLGNSLALPFSVYAVCA